MTAFPQYAKTTDPAVIAIVEANKAGWREHHEKACAFAIANGVPDGAYYPSNFAGTNRVHAIGGDKRPTTGQWKRGGRGYGWAPYKNSPLHAELEAIRFDAASLPGLPDMVDGPYLPNGSHVWYTPQPFIWAGAVWVGFSGQPRDTERASDPDPADGGWTEILASEYHAAKEGYLAAANAKAEEAA